MRDVWRESGRMLVVHGRDVFFDGIGVVLRGASVIDIRSRRCVENFDAAAESDSWRGVEVVGVFGARSLGYGTSLEKFWSAWDFE